MKDRSYQYTVRDVPERLDRRLREVASEHGTSLNKAVVAALSKGVGMEPQLPVHHDLDDLAGTWVHDEAFDKAMEEMDRVDEELWR
jgi:plasmid stability protein